MKLYANLHTHSTHSDGQYTPTELVRVAKAEGYRAIAITDHDTATAYPELKRACEEEGLECLFAVEFSVMVPKEYHVVAFDFDPEYPPMKEYLRQMGARQTDNTKHCFDAAVAKGAVSGITWDEVLEFNKGVSWIANNHVYKAMIAKGLAKEENYIKWFQADFNHQRALYPPLYPFKTLPEIESALPTGSFPLTTSNVTVSTVCASVMFFVEMMENFKIPFCTEASLTMKKSGENPFCRD